jgi:rod shape-determining protein MreC
MTKKLKYLITCIVIIAIIFFVYSPSRNKIARFVFSVADRPSRALTTNGSKIRSFFASFNNIGELRKQNEALTEKIMGLTIDRSKIAELEHENELLKEELGFAEKNPDLSLMPAKIIGREPTSFLDYVIIDKGENDGIKTGMGAIFGGALVGQVSEVYSNQAKVVLITSKDSIIQAMLQNSRSKGLLRGGISGLVLENIIQDVTFETGEYVVTSGLDGRLKPGILIGKTTSALSSSSDLFKNIEVEPTADLSRLELVFIIK